ncbi:hypothetical protein ACFWB2_32960 [Streptomyces virginiae]|uniref:hypothetical protein n=1 Tax=Streptomyces virginiae TaxID=1961 RepID=UPI0036987643
MDISAFRKGQVICVRYDPDQPWRVEISSRPSFEWAERAASIQIRSAPAEMLRKRPRPRERILVALLALAIGSTLAAWYGPGLL